MASNPRFTEDLFEIRLRRPSPADSGLNNGDPAGEPLDDTTGLRNGEPWPPPIGGGAGKPAIEESMCSALPARSDWLTHLVATSQQ